RGKPGGTSAEQDRAMGTAITTPPTSPAPPASVRTTRAVCSYCGVGCGLTVTSGVDEAGRRAVRAVAGDKDQPANRGRLCTKGATHVELMAAPGRMTSAMVPAARGAEPAARART